MTSPATFQSLIAGISEVHAQLAAQASRAVNTSLTLRNWLIGCHIAEFELHGADRAEYGANLLPRLSQELKSQGVSACGSRQLYNYLTFYRAYPQILQAVTAQSGNLLPAQHPLKEIVRSAPAQFAIPSEKLITAFSYTHFEQLIGIEDALQRSFYEVECLRDRPERSK